MFSGDHMVKNKLIALEFAAGKKRGKGSHTFIEGESIYSYGHHFPMASRIGSGFLMNKEKYSRSTSTHQRHVKNAIGDRKVRARLTTAQLRSLR